MSFFKSLVPQVTETAKTALDHTAGIGVVLTIAQWLPSIAALMSIAWYAYRFWEAYKAKKAKKELPLDE